MPNKEPARLSQATKQQMRDEKQAEQRAAAAAHRQHMREQFSSSRNTPQWIHTHLETFGRLETELAEAGDDDFLVRCCAFHKQKLSLICRAFEQQSIAASDVKELEKKLEETKEMLDCLLEVPCGPSEIAERYDDSYDDIYAMVSPTSGGSTSASCPPEAEPTVLQSTTEILQKLDFAETTAELKTAIEAAATHVSDQRVADAMVKARRKLAAKKNEGAAAAVLPTAERSRMPDIGSQLEAGAQSTALAQEETGHGRTVMNHSTHCEGLLAVMRRLEKYQFRLQVGLSAAKIAAELEAFVQHLDRHVQGMPTAKINGLDGFTFFDQDKFKRYIFRKYKPQEVSHDEENLCVFSQVTLKRIDDVLEAYVSERSKSEAEAAVAGLHERLSGEQLMALPQQQQQPRLGERLAAAAAADRNQRPQGSPGGGVCGSMSRPAMTASVSRGTSGDLRGSLEMTPQL